MSGLLRLGMTGGAACGKSSSAQAFAELGVPIIDADDVVRQLTRPGEPLLQEVISQAGPSVRHADGSLDRAQLRDLLFRDAAMRRVIERVLHPPAKRIILDWFDEQSGPLAIAVVPLLFETDWHHVMDRVLVVNCPASVQRERLLQREGITDAMANTILACQASEAKRLSLADDVLDTTGTVEELTAKVAELHEMYLHL